jgi:hypothetical protein
MSKQEETTFNTTHNAESEMRDTGNSVTRADETGDVAEANAPTSVRANAGMNTILGTGFGTGVQTDASDE